MKPLRTRLAAGLLSLAFCIPAVAVATASPAAAGDRNTIGILAYAQLNNPTRNYEYNAWNGRNCNWYTNDIVKYRGWQRPEANWGCDGWLGEQWCADFAAWVWDTEGVRNMGTFKNSQGGALARSFYDYAVQNNTYHEGYTAIGDAVVFWEYYSGQGWFAEHVAIVTEVYGNGQFGYIGGNQSDAVTHGVGWLSDPKISFTGPVF
jgi:hypothetical protein